MVREVVEAGADIDYAMTTHRIARRPTITSLEYAIHIKKYDVVAYLIECRAKVPSESIWPSRGKILKVLQKAVEERKKKSKKASNDVQRSFIPRPSASLYSYFAQGDVLISANQLTIKQFC